MGKETGAIENPRIQAGDHLTLSHTTTVDHGNRTRVAAVISECIAHCTTWIPQKDRRKSLVFYINP